MRRLDRPHIPFQVEIAPQVWRHLGAVPRESFHRIQQHLAEAAGAANEMIVELADDGSRVPLRTIIDGYATEYDVDHDGRVLTLVSVLPAPQR